MFHKLLKDRSATAEKKIRWERLAESRWPADAAQEGRVTDPIFQVTLKWLLLPVIGLLLVGVAFPMSVTDISAVLADARGSVHRASATLADTAATGGTRLAPGDRIWTEQDGRAVLRFGSWSSARLAGGSEVRLLATKPGEDLRVEVLSGRVEFLLAPASETGHSVVAFAEGQGLKPLADTEFVIDMEAMQVDVRWGELEVEGDRSFRHAGEGESLQLGVDTLPFETRAQAEAAPDDRFDAAPQGPQDSVAFVNGFSGDEEDEEEDDGAWSYGGFASPEDAWLYDSAWGYPGVGTGYYGYGYGYYDPWLYGGLYGYPWFGVGSFFDALFYGFWPWNWYDHDRHDGDRGHGDDADHETNTARKTDRLVAGKGRKPGLVTRADAGKAARAPIAGRSKVKRNLTRSPYRPPVYRKGSRGSLTSRSGTLRSRRKTPTRRRSVRSSARNRVHRSASARRTYRAPYSRNLNRHHRPRTRRSLSRYGYPSSRRSSHARSRAHPQSRRYRPSRRSAPSSHARPSARPSRSYRGGGSAHRAPSFHGMSRGRGGRH